MLIIIFLLSIYAPKTQIAANWHNFQYLEKNAYSPKKEYLKYFKRKTKKHKKIEFEIKSNNMDAIDYTRFIVDLKLDLPIEYLVKL